MKIYRHPTSRKKISRQRFWQLKNKAAGKCVQCGKRIKKPSKCFCLSCLLKQRIASRENQGCMAYDGTHGRPPFCNPGL